MHELTIIIVNWNTKDDIQKCLTSIKTQCDPERVRTIVVDNNSRDGSREMIAVQFPMFMVINSGSNLGFGRANNLGLKSATTPFVFFLNPDTVIQNDAVHAMIDLLKKKPDIAALQCKLTDLNGEAQTVCLQWEFNPFTLFLSMAFVNDQFAARFRSVIPFHDPNTSGFMKTIAGGCMMVRKELLDKAGWFDERFFMYAEDGDLCRRIRRAGGKIFYTADCSITHICGTSSNKRESYFSEYMKHESYEKLLVKYYGGFSKVLYRASVFSCGLIKFCIYGMEGFLKGKGHFRWNNKYTAMMAWSLFLRKAKIIP
jgi:GT2 family glycosyltransferase